MTDKQIRPPYEIALMHDHILRLEEELKAKEEELEQETALKETYLACYKAKHEDIKGIFFKYKQTLTEIKKIANKFDYWNSNLSQASEILHEIIEKTSEVLDE